jgi:hypothetical protein
VRVDLGEARNPERAASWATTGNGRGGAGYGGPLGRGRATNTETTDYAPWWNWLFFWFLALFALVLGSTPWASRGNAEVVWDLIAYWFLGVLVTGVLRALGVTISSVRSAARSRG